MRWPILALLCVLASLLVPGIASASTASGAETRVWAFAFAEQVGVGVERSLTLELHRGCEATYDEIASDSLLAARGGGKWTKKVVERSSRGADGASSRHIIEKLDGKTNSVTHQVTNDGKVIHQHQTHVGKHGTTRQFPDEWVEYPTIPPGGNK